LGKRSRKRSVAPETKAAATDRYARSREKDAAVRETLEPLAKGERPGAVTVAAILATVMAIANAVAAALGETLGSNAVGYTVMSTTILLACAGGMWFGARYWAVMGFMVVLVFQILSLSFAVIRVERWWYGLLVLVVIGLLGWMFWKLIRALARIQMPERPSPPPR
jgi:hypothetical protein